VATLSYTAYPVAAIVMTLSVLEGHSSIACLSSMIFRIFGALCGPSASAELLVKIKHPGK